MVVDFKIICEGEGKICGDISVELVSDEELLCINREFLDHDYYTDIITFDNGFGNVVSGELLISKERVQDNSNINSVSFEEELKRIIIHGVLHLCGYKDKDKAQKIEMTMKEDYYLKLV